MQMAYTDPMAEKPEAEDDALSLEDICNAIATLDLDGLEAVLDCMNKVVPEKVEQRATDRKRGADKARAHNSKLAKIEANQKAFTARWGNRIRIDNLGVKG